MGVHPTFIGEVPVGEGLGPNEGGAGGEGDAQGLAVGPGEDLESHWGAQANDVRHAERHGGDGFGGDAST